MDVWKSQGLLARFDLHFTSHLLIVFPDKRQPWTSRAVFSPNRRRRRQTLRIRNRDFWPEVVWWRVFFFGATLSLGTGKRALILAPDVFQGTDTIVLSGGKSPNSRNCSECSGPAWKSSRRVVTCFVAWTAGHFLVIPFRQTEICLRRMQLFDWSRANVCV